MPWSFSRSNSNPAIYWDLQGYIGIYIGIIYIINYLGDFRYFSMYFRLYLMFFVQFLGLNPSWQVESLVCGRIFVQQFVETLVCKLKVLYAVVFLSCRQVESLVGRFSYVARIPPPNIYIYIYIYIYINMDFVDLFVKFWIVGAVSINSWWENHHFVRKHRFFVKFWMLGAVSINSWSKKTKF